MKTKQEIFDTVLNHLRTQGKPAIEGDGPACRYLDQATGNKCAVGCFIPAEAYNPDIEGISIQDTMCWLEAEGRDYVPPKYQKLLKILENQDIDTSTEGLEFLARIQHAHDKQSSFASLWRDAFELEMFDIADSYELDFKERDDV